jgi:hypothetical protein
LTSGFGITILNNIKVSGYPKIAQKDRFLYFYIFR